MNNDLKKLIAGLPADRRAELANALAPAADPIAVIGMGCRFPGGVNSPEEFWQLLREGRDTVTEVPADRWPIDEYYDADPAAPGKMSTRWGAFLDEVDKFDASFFGISPREAARMDPQQRILLEVCWEALENAGQSESSMSGSVTGVFGGICATDYWFLQAGDVRQFDGYAGLGGCHSIAVGRLSYLLDLRGASVAVDTACSSSLVAVHLACQSLLTRECNMAVAGGVNLMVAPHATVFLSKWGMMAPDGRCKTFDSKANGIVRGEGCGFVVLKRLSDAQAAGDQVLALIRGSATSQDGRGTRLSAPNGRAQQAVVRRALEVAGVAPDQISFVETHGTGTPIGDPIEIEALAEVIGQPRPDGLRCALGSVKTNMGHLEAAAGVAGLIKAVLCLQHGGIPRHLHLDRLNPSISLEQTPFFIPQEAIEWPPGYEHRFAGVSSFGLSGTNAHAVLEAAPPVQPSPLAVASADARAYVLPISARSDAALATLVERYGEFLSSEGTAASLGDICYTAAVRRSHHPHRLAVVGRSKAELAERLAALSAEERRGSEARTSPRLAFIFSGQGSQWVGMGQELLSQEPVFRDLMEQCDAILRRHASWSLLDQLGAEEATSRLADTEIAQPAIFAIQVALLALYQSWGIRPDVVLGHSAGEIAAAYAAEVFSLEDALRIVFHRARLMQHATGQGRMAAVGLSADEAALAITGYEDRLAIAAINGPASTVLSGEAPALSDVLATLRSKGVFSRDLGVNYAFHSHQLDPILGELIESISDIQPRAAALAMVSTVTGEMVSGEELDAAHWARNMRQPVRFAAAVDRVIEDECQLFLEVGPHPVLGSPISQCLQGRGCEGTILASLRQGLPPRDALQRVVSTLYARGRDVNFSGLFPARGRCVNLPAYPWQHRRYWIQNNERIQNNECKTENTTTTHSAKVESMPSSKTNPPDLQSHSSRRELVSTFYDQFSANQRQNGNESFLTFAPLLERVPGFSWTLTFYEPDQHPREWAMIVEAQKQMRELLFRGIDFSAVRSIMDFGCGYGSDVVRFALRYPHVKCDGYTISNAQAEIGNEKIVSQDLQDRVSINVRDSSQDEFPGKYEVIFGLEVSPYIKDKHKLFSNIDRHLNDGGFLVLADFVAHTLSEIGHDETSSYISTQPQWSDILARYKLKVVRAVNVSKEISNFLYDPESESHLKELGARFGDEHIRRHCASYDNLGRMLQKKLASYQLLLIQKDRYTTKDEIARINDQKLSSPQPYAEAVRSADAPVARAAASVSPLTSTPTSVSLANALYEIQWQPRERQAAVSANGFSARRGSWLILADETGVGEAVAELLQARGETCISVQRGDAYESLGDGQFRVNMSRAGDFRELLGDALTADMPDCRGVIHLWGLDSTPAEMTSAASLVADRAKGCGSLGRLVQAISSVGWQESPRLWVGTRGAQSVDGSAASSFVQAAQWGMGRTIAAEHAGLWGGLIDVDADGSPIAAAVQLVEEILHTDGEDQVAFRRGRRHVARLVAAKPPTAHAATRLHADGRYVITGGLGDLGLQVARWMAEQGAGHLILMQRSDLPPRSQWPQAAAGSRLAGQLAAIQEIESLGTTVEIAAVDSADEVAMRAYFSSATCAAIRGVVHAAGIAAAQPVLDLDEPALDHVTRPKMLGGWLLHDILKDIKLDFFVLFSSASSVLNSPMLGGYAAANAFLDGLAHYRHGQGQPALAVNWGVWSEVGMAARYQQESGRDLTPSGMGPIAPAQGLQVLGQLLDGASPQVVVVPMDWSQLTGVASPMLSDLTGKSRLVPPPRAPVADVEPATTAKLAPRVESIATPVKPVAAPPAKKLLPAASGDERTEQVRNYLVEQAAKVLEVAQSELDVRQPLNRLGIDSLTAVELRNRIEADMGVSVTVVDFLEGASLADLAKIVVGQLSNGSTKTEAERLARARQQLDGMSDEAVKALLAEKQR